MRNQSASAAVSPVTHGQTTPTSSRHCRRHLRCVWLQRISNSNSSNSPYPGPGPDPDSGSGPSAFQFRPLSFPPFAPRRQPVRHNEHHCVLSAFVVSCSCGPPLLLRLPLSLSLSLPSSSLYVTGQAGCLFILFLVPQLSPSTFLALVCHVFPFAVLSRCLSNFCSAFWLCKKVASDSSRPGASSTSSSAPLQLPACPAARVSCSAPMKSVFKLID